jgi:uncharacterized protein (TIGR03435 family)
MSKSNMGRALLLAGLAVGVRGQAPEFEVASIKPNHSADGRVLMGMAPGGRFTATNTTVKQLIMTAYRIRAHQISGAPAWLDSEKYDIVAKPEGGANPDQIKLMLQALLAERFKLTMRHESKELPVYALVVGKSGPKFQASKDSGGPGRRGIQMGRGLIEGQQMTMEMFADQLSGMAGRTVLDKTGLTGSYDLRLEFTPDESQAQMFNGPGGSPPPDPNGPSLFAAVQEQLGLKLEAQKGPVTVYVIDRVEKPTEN